MYLDADNYYQDCVDNLQKWIQIPSIYDASSVDDKNPFGKAVNNALRFIGELALKDGFDVDFCSGYCTEISVGQGKLVSIYAHADVVPINDKWTYPPFGGVIDNNKMYGRGTSDDKGPAIASYYALKMLKDHNLIKNFKVTLVIGGNEETGSKCLDYYFNRLHKPYPEYGFTPDGDFPLIYGEKAIANYDVILNKKFPAIKKIEGGIAFNCVIDKCSAYINENISEDYVKEYCNANHLTYSYQEGQLVLFGRGAHGSIPDKGINAGVHMMILLGKYFHYEELLKNGLNYLDPLGKNMALYHNSPFLKDTTFNLGLISYQDGILKYTVNYRYGEDVDLNKTLDMLNKFNLGEVKLTSNADYLLFNPQTDFIKTLLKVYQEETDDYKSQAMTIGGGTYAKESKNTIAFGSHFPAKEDHIHEENEKIDLEDLLSSISIYARAIMALGELGGK